MRAFAIAIALLVTAPATPAAAQPVGGAVSAPARAVAVPATPGATTPTTTSPTPSTINEFFPEERSLSDCLSSLPKPGCGSDARGGWRQGLVLIAILLGLGVIAWRIVAESRKARA